MVTFKLIELLEKRGMTQKDLSVNGKIRAATISALCNNTAKEISTKIIDSICRVLNCTPGDFIEYSLDEEVQEKTDLMKAKDFYKNAIGTDPKTIERISLTTAEFVILTKILILNQEYIKQSERTLSNISKEISIDWLLQRVSSLGMKVDNPSRVIVWLANDYFLDDFTQVLYYIIKEHKSELIYDFGEVNEDSIFEGLYLKFIEKTDKKTIDGLEKLVTKNLKGLS